MHPKFGVHCYNSLELFSYGYKKPTPFSWGRYKELLVNSSDLLWIRQRMVFEDRQSTIENPFEKCSHRVGKYQELRSILIWLLVYPIHKMKGWYHLQLLQRMRCDCYASKCWCRPHHSFQHVYWICSKTRRFQDCRLLAAFLFQSYACVLWWSTLIVCHEKTPLWGVSGQFVNWSSSGWV